MCVLQLMSFYIQMAIKSKPEILYSVKYIVPIKLFNFLKQILVTYRTFWINDFLA